MFGGFGGGTGAALAFRVSMDSAGVDKGTKSLQGMNREAGKSPGIFKSGWEAVNKFVMAGFAVQQIIGIFRGIGQAISDLLAPAEESEAVLAQTAAVLKSTHGMAGMTASAITDLATALSKIAPYDDEAIQASENLLLTFTSISKKVFPETQKVILDVATAMHEDLQTATIQVGKAMQSAQGWTALKRIGVNISAQMLQTAQQLYATGHAAQAQQILLKELNTEFGGSAEAAGKTFRGALVILQTQMDNVKEALGGALLPLLTKFANFLMPKFTEMTDGASQAAANLGKWFDSTLVPALQAGGRVLDDVRHYAEILVEIWQEEMGPAIDEVTAAFGDFSRGAQGVSEKDMKGGLQAAFQSLVPAVRDVAHGLAQFIHEVLPQLKRGFGDIHLKDILKAFGEIASFVLHNIGPAFKAFAIWVGLMYAPIGLLIAGVVGLVGWLKNLWQTNKEFRETVLGAIAAVQQFAADLGERLGPAIRNSVLAFQAVMSVLGPLWEAFWPHLRDVLGHVWDVIVGIIQVAWSVISGIIKVGLDLLGGNFDQANKDSQDAMRGLVEGIGHILGGLIGLIGDIFGALLRAFLDNLGQLKDQVFHHFQSLGESIIRGIVVGIQSVAGDVGNAVHSAVANIPGVQGHVPGFASGTQNAPGGLAIVHTGEMYLPPHSKVIPAAQVERMQGAASGPARQHTINVYGVTDPRAVARAAVKEQRWQSRLDTLAGG